MHTLTLITGMPQLPALIHPVFGENLNEPALILAYGDRWGSAEDGMREWYQSHRPEQMPFRACYVTEPVGKKDGRVNVYFVPTFERDCQLEPIGQTVNDPLAVRILIANSRAGSFMSGIRWEVWNDREMTDLADIGGFTQWHLLGGSSAEELHRLASLGVAPSGNWDFYSLLMDRQCQVCGRLVGVNYHLFDIDSAECEQCGNRPFLSNALHGQLDHLLDLGDRRMFGDFSLRALGWMSRVRAAFQNVRKDGDDVGGKLLEGHLWPQTLIASATDPKSAERVRSTIEGVGGNFEMFRTGAEALRYALLGHKPFDEQTRIIAEFVVATAKLVRQKRLATN